MRSALIVSSEINYVGHSGAGIAGGRKRGTGSGEPSRVLPTACPSSSKTTKRGCAVRRLRTNTQLVNTERRFETGCIATLSDGISRHFVGSGADATRAVADYCDEHGLKLLCISTPGTIWRDLQGSREVAAPREADRRSRQAFLRLPESAMLNAIGRQDILP